MARELMPKSGIMMPHVVVTRDAAVVGVSTVDGVAGAVDLTGKYLQKTDAEDTYQTKTEGASKTYVLDSIQPIMEGALFKADPFVDNNIPFRSAGANGVESVDMIKVTTENSIKLGSYESSVQGVEIHSAGRVVVVDKNDSGVETKYPVYSKRFRPEIEDLPFAAIGSYVKDSKGRTIGVNRTGINSDIKQFTQKVTFQQPVTIADGVGDYDAVTMRQLRNSGGGSGGPTMSGISNFGIGDFHLRDSRAYIQPYEVVSDGQLLNRADWPELWAYAQMLSPISDTDWLADPAKRGKYSLGNGTTTFRVPDRNGVQSGSVPALFGRGDGGDSSHNGRVEESAAPDIKGGFTTSSFVYNGGVYSLVQNRSGAFFAGGSVTDSAINIGSVTSGQQSFGTDFSASKSSPVYGRQSVSEIRPNSFYGVWVIRASGGFVAANTSWSVKNADATAPSSGTTVRGGEVISEYSNQEGKRFARLYSDTVWGSPGAAVIEAEGAGKHAYKFYEDGTVDFRKTGSSNRVNMYTTTSSWDNVSTASHTDLTSGGVDRVLESTASDTLVLGFSIGAVRPDAYPTKVGFHQYIWPESSYNFGSAVISIGSDSSWCRYMFGVDGQFWGSTEQGEFTYTRNGVSDSRVKHDITPTTVDKAWQNLKALQFVTFIYNNDEQERQRRGLIAQQAETVDSLYVKTRMYPGKNIGDPMVEQKELDTTPMLLDTMHVVQKLIAEIDALKAEIADLKASK
ncbi:tail fiber protein [Escherichia phage O18-011]|uniref:Tail fiber n=1 Tax=Escherichia phage O18-011 TaxID=2742113 RepID=A0A6J4EGP9_9CAUD|nr:tail fiber protein [Escherichia phage O18-011]BCG45084.1 tail fiber [Escherichia phage O18-011]